MDKAASTFGPLEPERRIEAIDMLRGFALFGVLAVNMANFGVPVVLSPALLDQTAYAVMHFFFETKSWRLFSFLFGLGFSLQLLRAESRGGTFLPVYFRRLAILFIIGMGHTLFYRGDILMTYAMLGLILVVFRKVPPKALLLLSALLLAVFPVERALSSLRHDVTVLPSVQVNLEEARANLEELRRTHPYSVGSVADVMAHNAESLSLPNLPNPFTNFRGIESSPQFFAMFLLGLYTGRRRILHDVEKHTVLIRRVLWWGLAVGVLSMTGEQILITTVGYHAFREGAASLIPQFIGDVFLAFGSTALSFGYAAAIVVLAQNARWKRIIAPLGGVGRLALTVYLTQTLMFTTLFYGYAFGQFNRIGPAAVYLYAVAFFGLQIAVCAWWVRRFRFGPAEWLWRSLTYLRLQPLR